MLSVAEIANLLSSRYEGDGSIIMNLIRPVRSPDVGGLAIIFSKQDLHYISETTADILIGPQEIRHSSAKAFIFIDHLDVNQINLLLSYYKVHKYQLFDQGNTSMIPDVYIGKHCQIGSNCHFMPGVKIMNGVIIGNNVAIHSNTVIKEGTIIGNNVTIDSNNSIGNYSFEYMAGEQGVYQRVESIGRVIIDDNVDIGCNNTIDRGTLGNTHIGRGTKIDNQVQIGHDCQIGNHCLLVSQSGFSGHTILGNHVIVQGQAGTIGHITIGSHSIIKAKSGVSHSFPEKSDLFGYPAKETRAYYKNLAVLNILTRKYEKEKNERQPEGWFSRWFQQKK